MKSEYISQEDKAIVKVDKDTILDEVPILPLNNQVAFPTLNMSLTVFTHASALMEAALKPTKDGIDAADSNLNQILIRPEIEFSSVSAAST